MILTVWAVFLNQAEQARGDERLDKGGSGCVEAWCAAPGRRFMPAVSIRAAAHSRIVLGAFPNLIGDSPHFLP